MITNFEEITQELTADEKLMLIALHNIIAEYDDRSRAILSPALCERLSDAVHVRVTDVRLRKLVNFMRVHALMPIIATSQGYFCTSDEEELLKEIRSLNERASSIRNAAIGLEMYMRRPAEKKYASNQLILL